MKIISKIILLSLIFSIQPFAQEETLIGNNEITHGGFGAPVIKYTQIKDEPAVLVGGRGGWIINHSFIIGGGGYGLVNNIEANRPLVYIPELPPREYQPYINFGYGGLELEYIILSDNVTHFSVYTLIGAGGINYRNRLWDDWDFENQDAWNYGSDAFFVVEPAVNVEINIISFFRINTGVSYRFISGVNFYNLQNSDFAGLSAQLSLKFGKF